MNEPAASGTPDEKKLVQLYMELMGTSEADARSVLMYVEGSEGNLGPKPAGQALNSAGELPADDEKTQVKPPRPISSTLLVFVLGVLCCSLLPGRAAQADRSHQCLHYHADFPARCRQSRPATES
jgi:hypothetical protein